MAAGFRSARSAALRFHWGVDTYIKHERGDRGIGRAVRKYARAFKVDEAWLLGLQENESSMVRGIPIVGEAAIGRWIDVDIIAGLVQTGRVSAPATETNEDGHFAIILRDASMNREMPQGSYGICVEVDDDARAADFVVGDIVWLERRRGDLVERTFRRVVSIANSALRLATYSTDAKLRSEITWPASRADESIRILGKLVGKYADYSPS